MSAMDDGTLDNQADIRVEGVNAIGMEAGDDVAVSSSGDIVVAGADAVGVSVGDSTVNLTGDILVEHGCNDAAAKPTKDTRRV